MTLFTFFSFGNFNFYNKLIITLVDFELFPPPPGAPLTYFNDRGRGGGCLKEFFGSEILAKRDLFGSMKDTGFFLCHEKKEGFFWILYFLSVQINSIVTYCKHNLLLVWYYGIYF